MSYCFDCKKHIRYCTCIRDMHLATVKERIIKQKELIKIALLKLRTIPNWYYETEVNPILNEVLDDIITITLGD